MGMMLLHEGAEAFGILRTKMGLGLHFNRDLTPIQDEIDFQPLFCPPERKMGLLLPVGPVSPQLHENKMFKRFSKLIAAVRLKAPLAQKTRNTDIEKIKFR